MTRSEGELERAKHHLRTMRAVLEAVEVALKSDAPPGSDIQQAVTGEAHNLASSLTRIDAYRRCEEDHG